MKQKTLAEELWAIGVSATQHHLAEANEEPGLSSDDVDNYAEQYAHTLRKGQALLGYRPYVPKDDGEF